uniref:Uncharacterized protein n=1 Tax=Arundo donax TaxID=35708 RepID=A0A0A8YU09_ARUDO
MTCASSSLSSENFSQKLCTVV